jgi:phosphoglycerol geranylgeranyltransferase
MAQSIYAKLEYSSLTGQKLLAILIDPDDVHTDELLDKTVVALSKYPPDFILIGGSLISKGDIHHVAARLKKAAIAPVVLFPGDHLQLTGHIDATMLLSLISGRNPQFLIGEHVKSAVKLSQLNKEILSTGYMLIDCGASTSVEYISNTHPIPYSKNNIACATALAGEQLGMKLIYLEGGSGAEKPIHHSMIRAVKSTLTIPLFVGGGIRTVQMAEQIWEAGADVIVVGTAFFNNPSILKELTDLKLALN